MAATMLGMYSTYFGAVAQLIKSARRLQWGVDSLMDATAASLIQRELLKSLDIPIVSGLAAGAYCTGPGGVSFGGVTVLTPTYATANTLANSIANPTVVTYNNHGFTTASNITITGSNSTPTINGTYSLATSTITTNTFTVPVNVTVAGTTGTATSNAPASPGQKDISNISSSVAIDNMSRGVRITFGKNPGTLASGNSYWAVYPTAAQKSNWKGGSPFGTTGATKTTSFSVLVNRKAGTPGGKNMQIGVWRANDSGVVQGGFAIANSFDILNTSTNLLVQIDTSIDISNTENPALVIGQSGTSYAAGDTADIMAFKVEHATGCTLSFPAISGLTTYARSIIGTTARTAWHTMVGAVDVLIYYVGANVTDGDYNTVANHLQHLKDDIDADLLAQRTIFGKVPALLIIPTHYALRTDPDGTTVPGTNTIAISWLSGGVYTTAGVWSSGGVQPRLSGYCEDVLDIVNSAVSYYLGLGYTAAWINMQYACGMPGNIVDPTSTDWQHPNAAGATLWVSRFNTLMNDAISASPAYGLGNPNSITQRNRSRRLRY